MNAFGNGRRNARPRYNGNVAVIYDNSFWDARQYSLTGQNSFKPSTANATVTTMFGGPLKIPHLVSGEHTNFNINYQFRRSRNGNISTTLVPTADERAGNFNNVLDSQGRPVTVIDPSNGQPFAGNIIPQSRITSQATGLLAFYPLPNFTATGPTAGRYNYQLPIVGITNQDNVNSRISHTINQKNTVSGNFSFQRMDGSTPSIFVSNGQQFTTSTSQNAYNTGVNWTHRFSTRTFNTLGINFSRNSQATNPFFANRANVSGNLGITGNDQDPSLWGPPQLSFANGFASLQDGNTTRNRAQTTAITDSVRYFHGKHSFTFGGDFRRVLNSPLSEQNPRGTFSFTGGTAGFDFADFLLGRPDTSQIAFGNADKYFRSGWVSAYMTDDYRLTTKLSLSLGLRWDYQMPTTEQYGRLVNLDIGPNFGSFTTVCAATISGCTPGSQAGFPSSLIHGDPHELQPRIGYAWRPFTKGSTVIRGGYGIYFNTTVYQALVNQMSQQQPFSNTFIDAAPTGLFFPTVVARNNPLTTFAVDPNFRIGYSQSWQTAIQQNLLWGLVATVTYSGAKGTHQAQEFVPNSVAPQTAGYACVAAQTCPGNLYYMTSGGNTIANNLWLQMMRRFRGGFSGNLMYMHANSIDSGSAGGGGRGGQGGSAALIAQNWLDLGAERARTSGIRTHTLNGMMQFSTGQGARGGGLTKGFKGAVLKDWTITTNLTVASGAPLTPTVLSKTLGGTGIIGPLRAEYSGEPIYLPDGGLNPQAFFVPIGFYGNAGRNIITGPMLFSMNASAGRVIRLGERRSADLRFDSTNVLNHVSFNSWNTTVGSTQFGLPAGASAMRTLRATLRFRF
jgi:hypothetical protein